jgi:hypothetical protein
MGVVSPAGAQRRRGTAPRADEVARGYKQAAFCNLKYLVTLKAYCFLPGTAVAVRGRGGRLQWAGSEEWVLPGGVAPAEIQRYEARVALAMIGLVQVGGEVVRRWGPSDRLGWDCAPGCPAVARAKRTHWGS